MTSYSIQTMGHYRSPQNHGELAEPDVIGIAALNGRSPETKIYLQIRDGRISNASFTTFGCGISIACGSALTQLIQGKSLVECWDVTEEMLIDSLGGIPEHRRFCAELAIRALKVGIMRLAEKLPNDGKQ